MQASLLSEGRSQMPTSRAVDRPHNFLLKGSSGWRGARATDYYTGNVGGSFAAAGRTRTRDDNSCGSRLTASQQLAVTGLAK